MEMQINRPVTSRDPYIIISLRKYACCGWLILRAVFYSTAREI